MQYVFDCEPEKAVLPTSTAASETKVAQPGLWRIDTFARSAM